MPSTDTVIIGAGPYGLSLATYLKAARVPHQILGQPMHAWRTYMPPGMLLRSEAFASSLYAPHRGYTVEDYCRHKGIGYQRVGMALPLETFVDYALWFQSQLVGDVRPVDVVKMNRIDGLFHLSLSDGSSLEAHRVVIALGLKGFEKTPRVLQGLPGSHVSHSAEYGSLTWARDHDIAIVGGGQSALGLAALLNEAGARVQVIVRDASVIWHSRPDPSRALILKLLRPDAGLGRGWRSQVLSEWPFAFRVMRRGWREAFIEHSYGPSGAWWLRDRVVDKVDLLFRTQVREAYLDHDRVTLRVTRDAAQAYITADHVIAATGFKTDMRRHTFISTKIMDSISLFDGVPELTHNFETSVRGLYVVGPAAAHSFGPVMRFVYGAKYAAPRVAWHISQASKKDLGSVEWSVASSTIPKPTNERGSVL